MEKITEQKVIADQEGLLETQRKVMQAQRELILAQNKVITSLELLLEFRKSTER